MNTRFLNASVAACVGLTLLATGCGRADSASKVKDVGLVDLAARQTVIWTENGLVFSKQCLDTETNLTRQCQSGVEPHVTSYAGFFKAMASRQGVLPAYADFRGPDRLTRDISTMEKTLNEPGHTPQELAYAEERLNELNDMQFRLGKVQRVVRSLSSGQDMVYTAGVNEMYADIVGSLGNDLNVWRDRVNGRYWALLSTAMNWFDAMEMPRVVDTFGNPSEPLQSGCSMQLGQGWRVPSVAEANASYKAGLKQMPGIRQANPFWTSDVAPGSSSPAAMAYSVNIPGAQSRPSYQQVFTVCVRNTDSAQ